MCGGMLSLIELLCTTIYPVINIHIVFGLSVLVPSASDTYLSYGGVKTPKAGSRSSQ